MKTDADLLPWSAGPQGPTLAGCNGNGTLAHHPEKHSKVIEMLSHPWNTVHQIALETGLDPNTVAGISVHNVETVQANRQALRTKHSLIGRLSADQVIDRLVNAPEKIETRDLNILYGTSTDKDLAERGLPTAHIQVTHTLAQDIFSPLIELFANLSPALAQMGSKLLPRQLNAIEIESDPIPAISNGTITEPKSKPVKSKYNTKAK